MRPEITDPIFDVMKLQSHVLLGDEIRSGYGGTSPAGFVLRDKSTADFSIPALPDGKIN